MVTTLEFITDNWYLLVTLICAVILMVSKIIQFLDLPTHKKEEEVKRRLLILCTEAEIALGGETGRLKLSQVYDEFCESYPYLKKWISFETFSEWVDEVLPAMREILESKVNDQDTIEE